MSSFQVKFQRYNKNTTQCRISGTRHINAEDFAKAYGVAEYLRQGMADADPECEFRIISLLSHDYRGEDCEGGLYAFETRDEFSARVAKDAAKK